MWKLCVSLLSILLAVPTLAEPSPEPEPKSKAPIILLAGTQVLGRELNSKTGEAKALNLVLFEPLFLLDRPAIDRFNLIARKVKRYEEEQKKQLLEEDDEDFWFVIKVGGVTLAVGGAFALGVVIGATK